MKSSLSGPLRNRYSESRQTKRVVVLVSCCCTIVVLFAAFPRSLVKDNSFSIGHTLRFEFCIRSPYSRYFGFYRLAGPNLEMYSYKSPKTLIEYSGSIGLALGNLDISISWM